MSSKITTPEIEISSSPIFYNRKWGFQETITLSGKVIDEGGFTPILSLQDQILANYSQVTNTLSVGGIVRENVFLRSIDFGSSDYLSNTDYIVTFTSYPNDYFTKVGILDPQNTWEYSERRDGVLVVNHTVSARGINDSNSNNTALSNARDFVKSLVYPSSTVIPTNLTQFASFPHSNFILKDVSENTNRITGEYSITETYELDLVNSTNAIVRYTVDTNEPVQGFISVSINGFVEGGINTTFTQTKTAFSSLDFEAIINGIADLSINPTPTLKTQTNDEELNRINFNLSFDNSITNTGDNEVVLELNLNKSKNESGVEIYNLNGQLTGRLDLETKWNKIEEYYDQNIDIYRSKNIINIFSNYFDISEINTTLKNTRVSKDPFRGIIRFSTSIDNTPQPPEGLEQFEYTIGLQLPTFQVRSYPLVGQKYLDEGGSDEYLLQKLGYFNKSSVSINGFAVMEDGIGIEEARNIINRTINEVSESYIKGENIVTRREIGTNPFFGKRIEFNYTWEDSNLPINSEDDLSTIFIP